MDNRGYPSFDLPRYLSALPLFHGLPPVELALIAEGCMPRRLARGEAVFRVGDPCEEFHVAVLGQIKLFAVSPAGQEKVIEIIGPGGSFIEGLMFSGQPYRVGAEAVTEALVVSVSKQAVLDEIARNPRFSLRMLAGVSRRVHGLVCDVESYALHSGAQRVIDYLLRNLEKESGDGPVTVSLPVSKAVIASRLSLTPEHFSRVLHELEERGLIAVQRREILIREPQRLTRYQPR